MARKAKIDKDNLIGMLGRNFTPAEISGKMNVSRSAISQAMKRMKIDATKMTPGQEGKRYINAKLSAQEQMDKISQYSLWLLEEVMKGIKGEPTSIKQLKKEKILKWTETGADGKKKSKSQKEIEKFDFMSDPVKLAISSIAEIRSQIETKAELIKMMVPKEVNETLEAILDFFVEVVAPDARDRIMAKLRERLGLGPMLLDLHPQKEGTEWGAGAGGDVGDEQLRSKELSEIPRDDKDA